MIVENKIVLFGPHKQTKRLMGSLGPVNPFTKIQDESVRVIFVPEVKFY